jgi:hypothetical protein
MIHVGKTADLLQAAPMLQLINVAKQDGTMSVLQKKITDEIKLSLTKCMHGLGIDLSPDAVSTLAEDIAEVYKYESVEDICYCLKQGRQGAYSDIQLYGKFNMIIFQQWMARHLDKKYEAKEKQIQAAKQEEKEEISREEFYENGLKLREELQKIADSKRVNDQNYHSVRSDYFAKKIKGEI